MRYRPSPADISAMAYPQDLRGLDPRMQRIIEAAGAGNDDEILADASFSFSGDVLGGPAAQAPPTFSHHSNNVSSLQDIFACQASSPPPSSLIGRSMPQIQALQAEYQPEPSCEYHSLPSSSETADFETGMPRQQSLQTSFLARTAQRNGAGAPRLFLTPRNLYAASDASFSDPSAGSSLGAIPNNSERESTLANLHTQPQPFTYKIGRASCRERVSRLV